MANDLIVVFEHEFFALIRLALRLRYNTHNEDRRDSDFVLLKETAAMLIKLAAFYEGGPRPRYQARRFFGGSVCRHSIDSKIRDVSRIAYGGASRVFRVKCGSTV